MLNKCGVFVKKEQAGLFYRGLLTCLSKQSKISSCGEATLYLNQVRRPGVLLCFALFFSSPKLDESQGIEENMFFFVFFSRLPGQQIQVTNLAKYYSYAAQPWSMVRATKYAFQTSCALFHLLGVAAGRNTPGDGANPLAKLGHLQYEHSLVWND